MQSGSAARTANCERCAELVASWARRQALVSVQEVCFTSGSSSRLGSASPVRQLPPAVLRMICADLNYPATPAVATRYAAQGWPGEAARLAALRVEVRAKARDRAEIAALLRRQNGSSIDLTSDGEKVRAAMSDPS